MSTTLFNRAVQISLALLLAVFSTNIVPAMSAYAATGSNNGTLKVHEQNTPSGTESNDPQVCVFNFEGFGLDAGQTGDISITTQGGNNDDTILLTIPLTTDTNGNGVTSPYVNDTGSIYTLANGHYKATLDNKFGTDNGNKAKSKVFRVTCATQPTTVTPDVSIVDTCGTSNDSVIGVVTDGINYTITTSGLDYTVVASPVTGYTLLAGNDFTLNNDGTATRTVTLTDVACPRTITPPAPTAHDFCYTDQDYIEIPESEGVTYKIGDQVVTNDISYEGDPVTVTVAADDGYIIENGATTSWTFDSTTFTDEQCLTIGKSAKSAIDTNNDGVIGIGDTVTWSIIVTNTSSIDYESFYVTVDDPGTTLEDDGYIGYLGAGESRTLTATNTINFVSFTTCTITNTASFNAWRGVEEQDVPSLLSNDSLLELELPAPLATGSASAEYAYTCPTPGKGDVTPPSDPTPPTPTPAPTPAELPHTGPSDDNRFLLIGALAAILAYGAAYFAQPKKRLQE